MAGLHELEKPPFCYCIPTVLGPSFLLPLLGILSFNPKKRIIINVRYGTVVPYLYRYVRSFDTEYTRYNNDIYAIRTLSFGTIEMRSMYWHASPPMILWIVGKAKRRKQTAYCRQEGSRVQARKLARLVGIVISMGLGWGYVT